MTDGTRQAWTEPGLVASDFPEPLDSQQREVVVLLSSGYRQHENEEQFGYANHGPVSKKLAQIRRQVGRGPRSRARLCLMDNRQPAPRLLSEDHRLRVWWRAPGTRTARHVPLSEVTASVVVVQLNVHSLAFRRWCA